MRRLCGISLAIALILVPIQLLGQDACVALLKHGIYDYARSTQIGSSGSTVKNQICTNYSSYQAGTLHADASGRYALISGSGSLSKAEVDAIGEAMCSSRYSDTHASIDLDKFQAVISDAGARAFTKCIDSESRGFLINTTYNEDLPDIVQLTVQYSPKEGNPGVQHFGGFNVWSDEPGQSPSINCRGTLVTAARDGSHIRPGVTYSATCQRPNQNDPTKAVFIDGKRGLAYGATVQFDSDLGPVTFSFPPVYLPPPPSPIKPAFVGEIRAVAFQSDSPRYAELVRNGWLECDGRILNAIDYPDLYATLANRWGTSDMGVSFKIPDLRGQFLRGWDHGANNDPDAAKRTAADPNNPHPGWSGALGDAVGSRELDLVGRHRHDINYKSLDAQAGDGSRGSSTNSTSNQDYTPFQGNFPTEYSGGSETRPKNVSVMYVIYTGVRH